MSRNAAFRDAHNPRLADLVGTIESVPVHAAAEQLAAVAVSAPVVAREADHTRIEPRVDCRVGASQPCAVDVLRS